MELRPITARVVGVGVEADVPVDEVCVRDALKHPTAWSRRRGGHFWTIRAKSG